MNEKDFLIENIFQVKEKIDFTASNIDKNCWGLKSHIDKLNQMTLGFHPQELTIIAGRSGMGKTSFMTDLILELSKMYSLLVFSLEMPAKLLMERMLANQTEISLNDLKLGKGEKEKIKSIVEEIKTRNILIDDSSCISPYTIEKKLELIQKNHAVDCIMVDYLQLMRAGKRNESRRLEIDGICQELRGIGKKNNIPIILLSQLRRTDDRRSKEPFLSDLKESGGIEETADCVLLLHRPAYYQIVEKDLNITDSGEAYIFVAKNRNGMTGKIMCNFDCKSMHWSNVGWDVKGL